MSIFNLIKKHTESLYEGECTLTEFRSKSGIVNNTVATVTAENVPCRLSYKSIPNGSQTTTGAVVTQVIKLFLSPDILVKAGSRMIVTQNGVTKTFQASGEPAVYLSHQEVELTLKDRWA